MTDEELKKDLRSKVNGSFFRRTLFKRDTRIYYRRSFDDLFIYYRTRKVTEKQLLKILIDIGFKTAVCTTINKVVFFIPFGFESVEDNGLWKHIPYPGTGFSQVKKTKNTKYTAKYINNLYNKIQEDAN